jgi:nicotinate-nucleotide adenylyltransferase
VKLAILGGSFNPVHIGHLFLADAALSAFGYDRIILIPAFQSPFKTDAQPASPADRLDMLAASISGDPRFTIDDCEIRREGISYTIDTIAYITGRYRPQGKPGLIIGDDLARNFHLWKKAGEISEQADIIIARRLSSGEADFSFPYKKLSNEIMDISSGLIRERILKGQNWRYLVPAGARYIIEDRRLYGLNSPHRVHTPRPPEPAAETLSVKPFSAGPFPKDAPSGEKISWEIIVFIENTVRRMVSPSRFLHSRNTALLAWDLCLRFGLDPQAGYLAGIAHDICKHLPEDELKRLILAGGGSLSKQERKKSSLLHAGAAAVLLRYRFGIHNKDVLDAVRYHTTGGADMGKLAKVVYIADKIEISRQDVDPGLWELSRSAGLDHLFDAVFRQTLAYLRSQEIDLSYGTRRLLAAMRKRKEL